MHVIDTFFTLPQNLTTTLNFFGLTAAEGAFLDAGKAQCMQSQKSNIPAHGHCSYMIDVRMEYGLVLMLTSVSFNGRTVRVSRLSDSWGPRFYCPGHYSEIH